jgi:hypothetical protein
MDWWLQTGTHVSILNNESETDSGIQKLFEEVLSYNPPSSNVSSRSVAYSAQTECNFSKTEIINRANRKKYFYSFHQLSLLKTVMEPLHVQCVYYIAKFCRIVL